MYENIYSVALGDTEKARRRVRYEQRLGAVHKRANRKDRRRESEQSNTKRGSKQSWMKEQAAW